MNETTARCVICTGERAAHVGLLCGGHHQRLADMLREVEEQAAILSAVPSMQQRTGSGKGSLASERAPARLDVLVHLDPRSRPAGIRYPGPACLSCWHDSCTDIRNWLDAYDARATDTLAVLAVLGSWARLVREERNYADRTAATVTTERAYLTRNLDWCAEQDWIDEMYGDVRTLVSQLKSINGTNPAKPIAKCYLPAGDDLCGGDIWRTEQVSWPWLPLADRCVRIEVESPDGPAYCDRCGGTWEGEAAVKRLELIAEQEREAKRPLTDDGRKMLTAQELADQHGTTVNAVRLRLSRQRIKAIGSYYHPDALRKATA